jgi:hypothetical protein
MPGASVMPRGDGRDACPVVEGAEPVRQQPDYSAGRRFGFRCRVAPPGIAPGEPTRGMWQPCHMARSVHRTGPWTAPGSPDPLTLTLIQNNGEPGAGESSCRREQQFVCG